MNVKRLALGWAGLGRTGLGLPGLGLAVSPLLSVLLACGPGLAQSAAPEGAAAPTRGSSGGGVLRFPAHGAEGQPMGQAIAPSAVEDTTPQILILPPPEDTPEEILRTEIGLEGRSPFTGQPLSAADYAQLQAQLEEQLRTTPLAPVQFREIVFQLSILRGLRLILPFLP